MKQHASTKKTVSKTKADFIAAFDAGWDAAAEIVGEDGYKQGSENTYEHVRTKFAKKLGLAKEFDEMFRVKKAA